MYRHYLRRRQSRGNDDTFYLRLFACLSVFYTISQKPMQLGSPNLSQQCFTTSPGNLFVLGSNGQNNIILLLTRLEPETDQKKSLSDNVWLDYIDADSEMLDTCVRNFMMSWFSWVVTKMDASWTCWTDTEPPVDCTDSVSRTRYVKKVGDLLLCVWENMFVCSVYIATWLREMSSLPTNSSSRSPTSV